MLYVVYVLITLPVPVWEQNASDISQTTAAPGIIQSKLTCFNVYVSTKSQLAALILSFGSFTI